MIQHLYLVRHGQTDFNAEGRIQGQGASSSLSEKGRKQAELLGDRLQNCGFDCDYIFSSPLERALETARIATAYLSKEIIIEDLIQEISCGDFEGRLVSELDQKILARIAKDTTEKYPGGESSLDVRNRGLQFLQKLEKLEGESAIIFSHGNFLRNFSGAATGLAPDIFSRVYKDNAAISYLSLQGDNYRIVSWNDSSHIHFFPQKKMP